MKKVYYSITKIGRKESSKISGVGYITDEDLIAACISKQGKPYVRVFADAIKHCYQVAGTENEFKGAFYELVEVEATDKKDARTVELDYLLWFKLVD